MDRHHGTRKRTAKERKESKMGREMVKLHDQIAELISLDVLNDCFKPVVSALWGYIVVLLVLACNICSCEKPLVHGTEPAYWSVRRLFLPALVGLELQV
jgi:hypothetical protein